MNYKQDLEYGGKDISAAQERKVMPYSGKPGDLNAASSSLTLLLIIVTLNPAG
jgi:hypothetical protein